MPFWIPEKIKVDVNVHFDKIVVEFPTKITIEHVEGMTIAEESEIARRLKATSETADKKPEGGD